FRRTSFFMEASGIADELADKSASLGDLLFFLAPTKTSDAIFALDFGKSVVAADMASVLRAEGRKVFRCETVEELALLEKKESPLLLILAGQNIGFIEAMESIPGLANVPLLCIAEKFNDQSFKLHLANRPRTILCNVGDVFGDLALSDIDRIVRGDELLPAPTGAIIMEAIFFLNKYFREQISRWKLSECVNASEDYLSRIFHRQMGIPLWEYLNRLRIGYAIELLTTSAESVAEVASRAGFQDQAYFCRVFKRITGATPGAVRKKSGANVRKVQ
ncbi:MAG TPA: AraC family transcriptional regulator, partial [Rectinemataceae bacterium]|nr:AraC family transcriptional regulator [Rectinemataceae bacterium]